MISSAVSPVLRRWSAGLEGDEHAAVLEAPPPGPPPPRKPRTFCDAGILLDDLRRSASWLSARVEEGGVLLGLERAAEAAGVLQGEEALGHDDEEIDVEREGDEQRR